MRNVRAVVSKGNHELVGAAIRTIVPNPAGDHVTMQFKVIATMPSKQLSRPSRCCATLARIHCPAPGPRTRICSRIWSTRSHN